MKEIYKDSTYSIYIIEPNGNGYYFPYVMCVPSNLQDGDTLFVETNNEENPNELNNSAKFTTKNILNLMNGSSQINLQLSFQYCLRTALKVDHIFNN